MSLDFAEHSCQFTWPGESAFACFVELSLRYKKNSAGSACSQRDKESLGEVTDGLGFDF